ETRAGAELTRAQAQAQELQNRLNEIYAEPERRARLDQILQETARTRAQTELTKAQLDRISKRPGLWSPRRWLRPVLQRPGQKLPRRRKTQRFREHMQSLMIFSPKTRLLG